MREGSAECGGGREDMPPECTRAHAARRPLDEGARSAAARKPNRLRTLARGGLQPDGGGAALRRSPPRSAATREALHRASRVGRAAKRHYCLPAARGRLHGSGSPRGAVWPTRRCVSLGLCNFGAKEEEQSLTLPRHFPRLELAHALLKSCGVSNRHDLAKGLLTQERRREVALGRREVALGRRERERWGRQGPRNVGPRGREGLEVLTHRSRLPGLCGLEQTPTAGAD